MMVDELRSLPDAIRDYEALERLEADAKRQAENAATVETDGF